MLPLALGFPVSLLLGILGVRVLRRAKKMGGLPDRMVGVFFLSMAIGTMPALLAGDDRLVPSAHARLAMALGHAVLSVGFAALYVFAWRCFGPRSSWRRALALTGMAVLALLWAVQGLTEQFAAPGGPAVRATGLVRATALAWAFGESLRYRLMMRRRARLGLADPVVANRFLLWCWWTGGLLGANAVVVLFRFLVGDLEHAGPALHTATVICVSGLGLAGGISLWLAFFPPPTYILRLRAGAA
jgi:hypothetical protein